MKKMFLSAVMLMSLSLMAGAQTTGDQGSGSNHISNSGSSTGNSGATTGSKKGKSGKKGKQVTVNQRKMYTSKETGQSATPTGQEATSVNGTNATNPKNAARDTTQQ